MRVGSLFSGIGGFDLGLERAGMSIAWHSEIDPFASAVLRRHWPGVPNLGDVRGIGDINAAPVDVICGGFPCQDISVAGKGAGIDGERSGLWREYARIVRELRPRWVVAENVPALRTRGYDRVADDLEAAGYTVWPFVVGADDVGAPHRRKRVWIVAHADAYRERGLSFNAEMARPSELGGTVPAHADTQRREQQRRSGLFDGERPAQRDDADRCSRARDAADASEAGRERLRSAERVSAEVARHHGDRSGWSAGPPVPPVCELDDGIPAGLVRHRRPALAALGNALLSQIAEAIGRAILRIEHGR